MNDREKKIFECIIDFYLYHGEAVGSRSLVKNYNLEYSPATVRNIMSDLEDKGYISKEHSSSGRVPSAKGYKFYINYLLEMQKLSRRELANIKKASNITDSADLISSLTSHTSFSFATSDRFKKIELVYLDSNSFLAVIVTESGVKTKRMVVSQRITEESLKELSKSLNNVFSNQVISEAESLPVSGEVALLQKFIEELENDSTYISNKENLINYMAENNIFNVDTYKLIQADKEIKRFLTALLEQGMDNGKISIVLGEELDDRFNNLSFVFSTYTRDGKQGVIGVVGPRRMEYGKVAEVVKRMTKQIQGGVRHE